MARRAAPYVKTGYKVARNLATDYRKYKAAGQSAGTGTTRQHDAKVQYRKKRMPYRKKKKWISHVKKVKAVLAQDDVLRLCYLTRRFPPARHRELRDKLPISLPLRL